MSCDKTFTAIQIPSEMKISPLVRKIYEFEKNISSGNSSPVSFNVTPLSDHEIIPDFNKAQNKLTETALQVTENTVTENGTLSYASSLDPRLDLFYKSIRGNSSENMIELLEKSWSVNPRDTLRTLFYIRDCRGGKGERRIFLDGMKWLWNKDQSLFEKNLPCVPYYGCFKDLRKLLEEKENGIQNEEKFKQSIVSFWTNVLVKDVEAVNRNESISLAAKWVPIQNGLFTRELRLTHKLFRRMVRLLREKLDIVECRMSASEWDKINFERVCSLSHKKYGKAFLRHCTNNYNQYLEMVASGERKINVGQLNPSDIAKNYLQPDATSDQFLNLAWEQLLIQTRQKLCPTNQKFICVVDTSASMNGRPLEVAVSLGLFLSELYPESNFYRKFVTFSAEPSLQEVRGENLYERIKNLSQAKWQMNTNLQNVFSLLLDESTAEDHPDVVLILSDMQFDKACRPEGSHLNNSTTNLEEIERHYKEKGLNRPKLVFWNLNAFCIDFPTTTEFKETALISGYSPHLISALLEQGEINPMSIYRKVIDSTRYDLVFSE
jgi:hypothetical protein